MKRIHINSLLLGIGLGIITTALLGMLFFLGYEPVLSNEEIMKKAEALGMTYADSTLEKDILQLKDGTWSIQLNEDESIHELARRLQKSGVIESELEFEITAKKGNKIKPVMSGNILVPSEASVVDLVSLLLQ